MVQYFCTRWYSISVRDGTLFLYEMVHYFCMRWYSISVRDGTVFLKEFFEKVNFEKKSAALKLIRGQTVNTISGVSSKNQSKYM